MATVAKLANANTNVATGWSSPTNAYADDGAYATATPAKNGTISSDFGFPAFSTSDIPDGATINNCTVEVQWKVSTTASIDTLGVQLHNPAGTALGSESTETGATTSDSLKTQQVASGISLANLRSANLVVVRVRASRGNTNTAYTASLDYAKLTVDYTPNQNMVGTGAGAGFAAGELSGLGNAAGTSAGGATGEGSATALGVLSGVGAGAGSASGVLEEAASDALEGSSAAAATASGILSALASGAGAGAGAASATAAASALGHVNGASAGLAVATGTFEAPAPDPEPAPEKPPSVVIAQMGDPYPRVALNWAQWLASDSSVATDPDSGEGTVEGIPERRSDPIVGVSIGLLIAKVLLRLL